MKIVVAPDSYKGNMRSSKVCEIIKLAILQEQPDVEVLTFPMADGGEGTVDAVVEATGGRFQSLEVCGPLGEPVAARHGLLPDGTAIMEMASASGIELVPAEQLNPMKATTYGTGELLKHLLEEGHSSIVMGIGGSATVDGGVGMARALGYRFLDDSGSEATALADIASIDGSGVFQGLGNAHIRVACDVTNPLTGPNGAAAVFGPQKGATPEMIEQLDAGLANLWKLADVEGAPGDGAAGGLGYGLRAFCGAEIVSGANLIAETVGLPAALEGADLLITGEGRTDGQTASGKLCSVLAGLARDRGAKTLLLSGALQGELNPFLDVFDYAFSISAGHTSLEACIAHAPEDLAFVVKNVMRILYKQLGRTY
ncbi:glycerate kinase [Pontiella sulfatireligans]|uniref:Glycerate 3-kinase n=1 Tax=Pontiella sulfatireligans TaxID=2750658 RepID=A0A6C2UR88_9BACT|nr:glycerate kinase [Pontiella sulfatireligans]VGO22815.1 Glycerate 3-kinase [Pontiella sulfatireligans]